MADAFLILAIVLPFRAHDTPDGWDRVFHTFYGIQYRNLSDDQPLLEARFESLLPIEVSPSGRDNSRMSDGTISR